jgi:hypothetical protein
MPKVARTTDSLRPEPRFCTPEFENSAEIGGHFHRQAISKSVIIMDVPIAIGRGEGRGNNSRTHRR